MKGYKGFSKGMICRGKQYAENTVFEEDEAIVCSKGMHFCKEPLDVLEYYPLLDDNGDMSEFAEVEALDEAKTDDDKKFCTKKLKIGAKIDFAKLVQASVNFEYEKIADTKIKTTKKDCAQIGSSGNSAKIGSSGDCAKIGSSGNSAQIGSSGNYAKIGSSGDCAKIGSSGNSAQIGSSGYSAQIGSSGDFAQIGSSGDFAKISSTGKYAVICCAGDNSCAKGKINSWLTLAEWEYSEQEKCNIPICVKTEKIDGIKIKEDTFYKLQNGEFVEVTGE
uniref:DUF7666 domain-containing protein n=1 Tax=Siphoviridae sp. cttDR14 TaxID=2826490 RepID=A0A8S5M2M7_9CAUD|nr:MAG TPA: hypothetical protein [Siphoviridae sp. cttDR14]